ncbi:Kinetochore protein NDC80-like protein [Heterocephalus glaber]|uniref:Kinetochore protein NDC80 homolog n=1 Tax=Heterocephalus glaber TaxID=10181 RepID=G5BM69_HETGA|nr:Kinetochore protein NDC80-like protein [Heterocephalus glaber]
MVLSCTQYFHDVLLPCQGPQSNGANQVWTETFKIVGQNNSRAQLEPKGGGGVARRRRIAGPWGCVDLRFSGQKAQYGPCSSPASGELSPRCRQGLFPGCPSLHPRGRSAVVRPCCQVLGQTLSTLGQYSAAEAPAQAALRHGVASHCGPLDPSLSFMENFWLHSKPPCTEETKTAWSLAPRSPSEKCQLLDKVSRLLKEQEALETALKEARLEEAAKEKQRWEAAFKKAARDRAQLQRDIPFLLRELREQQSLRFQQRDPVPSRGIQIAQRLSVNKPTSERKVSVFGKRTSGHRSWNSQLGIFSSSEKIKDPRPLNDKAFIQQCIRQLCEFLTENVYAYSVSMKSFQAPSAKDFLKIFTFLYGFLCPSYELPDTKFEEEVPRIFKDLGYPSALSKSSMYTVGTPHTWLHIFAALIWLIDCIKIHNAMKESSLLFDDGQPWGEETEDGIMHNKLFLDYTIRCYESFMTGADTFEEMNAELQSKLKDLYNVIASKLESLATENKALNEQIARLEREREKEPNPILDQKLSGLDEEISRVELECETIKQENARLQNVVDNRKYSVADIERINHEKNDLQQTINKLTKDLEAEQWNEELKYARAKEAIETQLAEYHKLARKLKLIPKGAENSKGYDFEIKFNPEGGANCLVKYRAQVYVPLKELLNENEEKINKARNKKMGLEDTLEQLNTMKTESRRSVRTLKEEVQKLDDLYQQKVKEAEEEDEKCASELESLEKHKHLLESAVNEGLSEPTNELEAVQRECQLVVQTTTEERRKVGSNLQRLLEMVAMHVGAVEKHLEEQTAKIDREYEECVSEDLLENIRDCRKI